MKTQDDPTSPQKLKLSRRRLLTQAAAAAGGLALEGSGFLQPTPALASPHQITLQLTPSFTASVLRREDMLALRFNFYNLVLQPPNLVRQQATQAAYIVVYLGYGNDNVPQNIAEQAFLEAAPEMKPPDTLSDKLLMPGNLQAALAGPTWLAFRVPDTVASIPFTLDELLAWVKYEQSVVPVALPPGSPLPSPLPKLRAPGPTETNIEAPWQLILSPSRLAAWAHAKRPVTRTDWKNLDRTEVWHTRLGVRAPGYPPGQFVVDEQSARNRTLRAVWTPGYDPKTVPDPTNLGPFRMSLTPNDRWQLVELTSAYGLLDNGGRPFTPLPVAADRFMLSGLGAWMNTRGFWQPPGGATHLDIMEWRHQGTMARDHYVKVVHKGYLYPTGHPAALIKVTERKLQPTPDPFSKSPPLAAYLRQRFFIVVRQPEKTYPAPGQPDAGRQWPYKNVTVTTLVTPNLGDPNTAEWDIQGHGQEAFWPRVSVNGAPQGFEFHMIAEDADGQKTEFSAPLAFISVIWSGDSDFVTALNSNYASSGPSADDPLSLNPSRRERPLSGQKVAFAPSKKPGDTTIAVNTLTLGGAAPGSPGLPDDQPSFYPIWTEAAVRLTGVEQVKGDDLPTVVQPHPTYVANGFDTPGAGPTPADLIPNPADVFLKMKDQLPLSFGSDSGGGDKSGGLITPNMGIGGFSRLLGPMGGDVSSIPQKFDPASFFSDAKILGGILLKEIIKEVLGFLDLGKVPKTISKAIYPNDDILKPPEAIETELSFKPDLQPDGDKIFDPTSDGATMEVKAKFRQPLVPKGTPTYDILGDLRNFRINLLGTGDSMFLVLRFNQLTFKAKTGKKPTVDVDINKVEFAGVLTFVNTLKDYLKSGDSGPSLDITPTQVQAGYSLAIPSIGVGLLTIQNISFGAKLTLPFTGRPARVRFNFCERESPFTLTVWALGGGGFFAIAIGLDGVEMLEASFEATASLALDVGIASGEVHATVGIYFKMEGSGPDETAALTAYIRMGGSLDVLGIISISIELYLELKYKIKPENELWGQAKLTISVHVIFFSINVDVSVERKIAGGGGTQDISFAKGGLAAPLGTGAIQQNFADLVGGDDWADYCDAFVPVYPVS